MKEIIESVANGGPWLYILMVGSILIITLLIRASAQTEEPKIEQPEKPSQENLEKVFNVGLDFALQEKHGKELGPSESVALLQHCMGNVNGLMEHMSIHPGFMVCRKALITGMQFGVMTHSETRADRLQKLKDDGGYDWMVKGVYGDLE